MKRWMAVLCVLALTGTAAQAANYGVIFSGGGEPGSNYDRYYEQTLRIWQTYTGTLGYPTENVYVLFADGLDPAIDRSSGVSSDWSMVPSGQVLSATPGNLQSTLGALDESLTSADCFHFWSFDHGYPSDIEQPVQDGGGLVGWGSSWMIPDEVFASWVNPIGAGTKSFAFGQCYAGDMVDDLDLTGNSFAAWAADWYEPSNYADWVDAWADGIDLGLRYTHELGEYAKWNDLSGPLGSGDEHPGWMGANFHIVTNAPIPAPGAIVLGALGTGIVSWLRRRRMV